MDGAATLERTLLVVKPDGVARGHVGEILRRVEAKGYRIVALDLRVADRETLAEHYADHVDKPFYPGLEAFMASGPVVVAVVEGVRVVEGLMTLCGPTDPTVAPPGTIRGDLGHDWGHGKTENVVHRSDCPEAAEREIKIWFGDVAGV
ncbi:nucleoside-diphosphate kinase [Kineosporia sp. R_H_3]|uniref:nucleoside-diphosphate kinase n=1 Tax=Kineosporia sp. R_H_3 TaxID=1961848 RepID=UPI000B4BE16F|nr:nucleoside-diphosphate kinase [Kineosporia sp. R_H_3]